MATKIPKVHRVESMGMPLKPIPPKPPYQPKGAKPAVCALCGITIGIGLMAEHKSIVHGEHRQPPQPPISAAVKAQMYYGDEIHFVSGGLPSLGKGSR